MAIFRREITWWIVLQDMLGVTAAYWLGLSYMPRQLFLELLNGILVSMTAAVFLLYAYVFVKNVKISGWDRVTVISAGVAWSWAVTGMQAITRGWFLEVAPHTVGRTFDALGGLPAFGYIIGCGLHIAAIGLEDHKIERRSNCLVIWSILCGIAGVLILKLARGTL